MDRQLVRELSPCAESPKTPYSGPRKTVSSKVVTPYRVKKPSIQIVPVKQISNKSEIPVPSQDQTLTPKASRQILPPNSAEKAIQIASDINEKLEKLTGRPTPQKDKNKSSNLLIKHVNARANPVFQPNEPYLDLKRKEEQVKERRKSDSPSNSPLRLAKMNQIKVKSKKSQVVEPEMAMTVEPHPESSVWEDEDNTESLDITDTILTSQKVDQKVIKDEYMTLLRELFERDSNDPIRAAYVRKSLMSRFALHLMLIP